MKRAIFLLSLVLVMACPNDDNNDPLNIQEFRATQLFGGGQNINFDVDDIQWTFNFSSNLLTVENNVEAMYPGTVASGTYGLTFVNNLISFNDGNFDYIAEFNLSNDDAILTLFFDLIPQAVDDEITYIFQRIE